MSATLIPETTTIALVIYIWRASWHINRNRPVVIKRDDGTYRVARDLRAQRPRR